MFEPWLRAALGLLGTPGGVRHGQRRQHRARLWTLALLLGGLLSARWGLAPRLHVVHSRRAVQQPATAALAAHPGPTAKPGADQLAAGNLPLLAAPAARPQNVRDWTCGDVAAWLQERDFAAAWQELDDYAHALCRVGVTGAALYRLEEDVLRDDLQMRFRLHRKLFLEAIATLKVQQPRGQQQAQDLWEYRRRHIVRATVYLSGALTSPRVTILWLWLFEHQLLHRVRAAVAARTAAAGAEWLQPQSATASRQHEPQSSNDALQPHEGGDKGVELGTRPRSSRARRLRLPQCNWDAVLFWAGWMFVPGLQVASHAMAFWESYPALALLAGVTGVARTLVEGWAAHMLIAVDAVDWTDKLSSFICSHVMVPVVFFVVSLIQVVLAPITPRWLALLVFWLRCLALPPAAIWASFASWLPGIAGVDGAPRAPARRRERVRAPTRGGEPSGPHWPPPLVLPDELDELPDVPHHFKCPITLAIMRQPAQTPAGLTYERSAMLRWLEVQRCDPTTKQPLRRRHLSPNLALRAAIEHWAAAQRSSPAPHSQAAGPAAHDVLHDRSAPAAGYAAPSQHGVAAAGLPEQRRLSASSPAPARRWRVARRAASCLTAPAALGPVQPPEVARQDQAGGNPGQPSSSTATQLQATGGPTAQTARAGPPLLTPLPAERNMGHFLQTSPECSAPLAEAPAMVARAAPAGVQAVTASAASAPVGQLRRVACTSASSPVMRQPAGLRTQPAAGASTSGCIGQRGLAGSSGAPICARASQAVGQPDPAAAAGSFVFAAGVGGGERPADDARGAQRHNMRLRSRPGASQRH